MHFKSTCGAVARATFLVDAFRIHYNVVANERSNASPRRHKYVAFARESSGGGSLRNRGGLSGWWRRDASGCTAVRACIQPDIWPEFAAVRVSKKLCALLRSSRRTCTLLPYPAITHCSMPALQRDAVLKYTYELAGTFDTR